MWLIPAAGLVVLLLSAATFLGGHAASGVSGHGLRGPRWRFLGVADLGRIATSWPGTPTALVWVFVVVLFVLFLAVVAVPGWMLWRTARGNRDRPAYRSMATAGEVRRLHTGAVAVKAVELRPSLSQYKASPERMPLDERGVVLGTHLPSRKVLQGTWEDSYLAIMGPRSGKTTALAAPWILSAPGAVVASSIRADIFTVTAALRAERTGQRVWVFDPQHITHEPQQFWWNPLRGVRSMDDAVRLASAFVMMVDEDREIWGPAATELLSDLILAAALGGRVITDVYDWLYDEKTQTPRDILRKHGHHAAAASLLGMQGLEPETRSSVYFTARTGCSSLRDKEITDWLTPREGQEEFLPTQFIETNQTLYLMSKRAAGGTSAAALVAALTNELSMAAQRAAERRGGRIDAPALFVLDEVRNICRIGDLPQQYSYVGGCGIIMLSILQSYSQGETLWGKAGMKELWGSATVKLIGSGADDPDFAGDMSRLIGDHWLEVRSSGRSKGGWSENNQLQREAIMSPADVRAVEKGDAILLATGIRPAMVRLQPWFSGENSAQIAAAKASADRVLVERANQWHTALDGDQTKASA